ncbi:MAG: tRNA pseudouridine(55) synthase TruB [Oscillospiraceae bacterium]|nr:tRNA pseudouridine(55) synthase TruB [Oscillospiraceae bacterium]
MTNINNINGVLNLNKPAGCSSHDMVYLMRRLFNLKRVGHTGTLDPMATGVLPMLFGSATKLSDLLSNHDKQYKAVLKLGITTDTMDVTGNILNHTETEFLPDFPEIKKAVESFIGEIGQVPPVYSAIKIKGKKLYEYARNGIEIKPEPRKVNIYSIICEKTENPGEYILDINCSKGTYIRSICHDIGEKLSCGGVMADLERIRTGNFDISKSFTPDYLEKSKQEKGIEYLKSLLISCEDILINITDKKIFLDEFYSKLAKNGAEIYIYKIKSRNILDFSIGDKVLMYDYNNILFALGEVKDYHDGIACKPVIFI